LPVFVEQTTNHGGQNKNSNSYLMIALCFCWVAVQQRRKVPGEVYNFAAFTFILSKMGEDANFGKTKFLVKQKNPSGDGGNIPVTSTFEPR
jgi:hypothetical protein